MLFTTINYPLLETLCLLFAVVISEGGTRTQVQ